MCHTKLCPFPPGQYALSWHRSALPLSELGLWQLCRTALQLAHLGASEVAYVAVHGTGTPLGDPIEVGALGAALGGKGGGGGGSGGDGPPAPLVIGSSKVILAQQKAAKPRLRALPVLVVKVRISAPFPSQLLQCCSSLLPTNCCTRYLCCIFAQPLHTKGIGNSFRCVQLRNTWHTNAPEAVVLLALAMAVTAADTTA